MGVTIQCPRCGKRFEVESLTLGTRITCSFCRHRMRVGEIQHTEEGVASVDADQDPRSHARALWRRPVVWIAFAAGLVVLLVSWLLMSDGWFPGRQSREADRIALKRLKPVEIDAKKDAGTGMSKNQEGAQQQLPAHNTSTDEERVLAPAEIAKNAFPSVVMLTMHDQQNQPVALGSGFVLRKGMVATNTHVIEKAYGGRVQLIGSDATYVIEGIVAIDGARDLALLAVSDLRAPALSIGDSGKLGVGETIYVVGSPMGLKGTLSQGIVSGIRDIGPWSVVQISAPISPGSSGGPVLNVHGEVIGVAVATIKSGQNLNFAVPSSYLTALLSSIKDRDPVRPLKPRPREESAKADLGTRTVEGVVIDNLKRNRGYRPGLYFTIRNTLSLPVKNIRLRVLVYDQQGKVIHFEDVKRPRDKPGGDPLIPPGLAITTDISIPQNVYVIEDKPTFEVRVLDFTIAKQ